MKSIALAYHKSPVANIKLVTPTIIKYTLPISINGITKQKLPPFFLCAYCGNSGRLMAVDYTCKLAGQFGW